MAASAHVLVLGGQRSGKSRYAEELVVASGKEPVYLATATAGDAEMAARIAAHKARRADGWLTVEEPLDLAGALLSASGPGRAVVVDCLTLWLSNLFGARRTIEAEVDAFLDALDQASGVVAVVSNEVGSGIIPLHALARQYADAHGVLNARVAERVGRVVLMAAGIPIRIKPAATAPVWP